MTSRNGSGTELEPELNATIIGNNLEREWNRNKVETLELVSTFGRSQCSASQSVHAILHVSVFKIEKLMKVQLRIQDRGTWPVCFCAKMMRLEGFADYFAALAPNPGKVTINLIPVRISILWC